MNLHLSMMGRQWILHHWYDSNKRGGGTTRKSRDTYWATLGQVAGQIINRSAGKCQDLEELRELLENATELLKYKLEEQS